MPQIKHYTAKREVKLDCGHTVKAGEPFQINCIFTCAKDGTWPMRILMACFAVLKQKRNFRPSAKAGNTAATAQPPVQQSTAS
jgi:hypothetical protein